MRLLAILVIISSICSGQERLDAEAFFTHGLMRVYTVENETRESITFPWLDQVDIRTETRDFDFEQQEYTFRVSPSTSRIRNAQKALYDALAHAPDFELQERNCALIYSLHQDWLSLFSIHKKRGILTNLMTIIEDRETVYEKMLGSYELDPERILKLHTEKSDLLISLHALDMEQDYILNRYDLSGRKTEFDDFISVEGLRIRIENDLPLKEDLYLSDLKNEYKKEILQREIELESSEKSRYFDFLQLKYNGPHSDLFREKVSLGMGFQLSDLGDGKLKRKELMLEKQLLDLKSDRSRLEKQDQLEDSELRMTYSIQDYLHFMQVKNEERKKLQNLENLVAEEEGVSPLFFLEIEERNLIMSLKALNKKESLLEDYLLYLEFSEKLCQSEFVNFLVE